MQTVMRRLYKDRWGYAFIAPSFALFAVFFLIPVVWGGYLSLLDYQVFNREWVGLQNYREILHDSIFWLSLRNTALYTLGIVPLWLGKALIISALIFPLA
ncbi:MAG TPA: sugar ABC transporter permease, partial [Bacillota bacterium]|nr:sugar ABC transporter permease [Bacillota bacterium]